MKVDFYLDTSYFIYFNIFSAHSALKKIKMVEEGDDVDLTQDTDFIHLLDTKFTERLVFLTNEIIKPMCEDYGATYVGNVPLYAALDCAKERIWRVEKNNDYKLQRRTDTRPKPFNIGAVFSYVVNILLKSDYIVQKAGNPIDLKFLRCDRAEGDDIIATMVKHSKAEYKVIIANDRDFVQLLDENTILIDVMGNRIRVEELENNAFKSKEQYLLYKILFGDISDNIPHIRKGYGKKKCLALSQDTKQVLALLKEDTDIARQFKLNSELIDMSKIPPEIENNILEAVKAELTPPSEEEKENVEMF